MLDELLVITRTGEFEDSGNITLASATWLLDSLHLAFDVEHGDGVESSWVVHCSRVVEHLLTDSRYQVGLNLWQTEHPLLDQYTQQHFSLYVSAVPTDGDRVAGELWQAHRKVADDWISFERYLNTELPLRRLLSSGNALIAAGPDFLINAYATILEAAGCGASRVALGRPDVAPLQLLHFGASYVVAAGIGAIRSAP